MKVKGLILKDLILMKNNFKKLYVIIIAFSLLPGFQNKDYFLMLTTFIVSMLLASQVVTGIAIDEQSGWKYAVLSMPVSIRQVVLEKYILTLGLAVLSAMILSVTGGLAGFVFDLEGYSIVFSIIEGFLLVIIFNLLNIPVTYRYGAEAAKYFLLLFIAIPVIAVYVFHFFKIDGNAVVIRFMDNIYFLSLGIAVIAIMLIAGSVALAVKSYEKLL